MDFLKQFWANRILAISEIASLDLLTDCNSNAILISVQVNQVRSNDDDGDKEIPQAND